MKKLLIILLLIPVFVSSQTTEELDFIAPFNEGLAAIKKGDSWGFINNQGAVVIPFRDDFVLTEVNGLKYPIFNNNRSLISANKNGIKYFGYIDNTGKTVIKPKFLNATNFDNNKALALYIIKQTIGNNDVLDKNMVNYRYFEVTIDSLGNVENYLNPKGVNIVLDEKYLKSPPAITSRKILTNIYTVMTENMRWKLIKINK